MPGHPRSTLIAPSFLDRAASIAGDLPSCARAKNASIVASNYYREGSSRLIKK